MIMFFLNFCFYPNPNPNPNPNEIEIIVLLDNNINIILSIIQDQYYSRSAQCHDMIHT